MKRSLKLSIVQQAGFTLIEILVALAITSILTAGATAIVSQTFNENVRASQNMEAIQQVENAGYWVNHDVMMAQNVMPGAGSGFPLTMTWIDWQGNENQVIYTLMDAALQRSFSVNGGLPEETTVAQRIDCDSTATNCQFASGMLTFNVTATVGTRSESRTYQIKIRPDSAP